MKYFTQQQLVKHLPLAFENNPLDIFVGFVLSNNVEKTHLFAAFHLES